MKRTHLPLNALRVFDAAARHLSFTRAADELAVTPAAVGQQIRALEDVLGVVLFKRMTRNLELTPEAERGLPALRAGFLRFEESVLLMQEGQHSRSLTIAAPRDVVAHWLARRLSDYAARNHDVRFLLVNAEDGVDFVSANLDLAIVPAHMQDEADVRRTPLFDVRALVVAAPRIFPADIRDVAHIPLIHHPGSDWRGWLTQQGIEHPQVETGLTVGDAGLAVDAAVAGYGLARVPDVFVEDLLADGRLRALGTACETGASYVLAAPDPQWRQAKVHAFISFLTGTDAKAG